MSCDILPCPESQSNWGTNHHPPSFVPKPPSDSDSSFERLKQKHVRDLKQEYAEPDPKEEGGLKNEESHCGSAQEIPERDTSVSRKTKRKKLKSVMESDTVECGDRKTASNNRISAPDVGTKKSDLDVETPEKQHEKQKWRPRGQSDEKCKVQTRESSGIEATSTEVTDDDNADVGAQPKEKSGAPEHGCSKGMGKKRGSRNGIIPVYQTSPKHGVDSTIGQVCAHQSCLEISNSVAYLFILFHWC